MSVLDPDPDDDDDEVTPEVAPEQQTLEPDDPETLPPDESNSHE